MSNIEQSIDVNVPVSTAYNQWTQFEEFPRFMEGVQEVRQTDDTHLHWKAKIGGKEKEWDAQIVEQVPDKVIAWRSISGAPNAGTVRFEPIDTTHTRINLTMEYEPQGVVEKAGDTLGFVSGKVEGSVERFKELLEKRRVETGAWRGEVHGGRRTQ